MCVVMIEKTMMMIQLDGYNDVYHRRVLLREIRDILKIFDCGFVSKNKSGDIGLISVKIFNVFW